MVEKDRPRGGMGVGAVHHVAWRVKDDAEQLALRSRLMEAGLRVTDVQDRCYFRSIYFREPGGVLFEVATDAPGFAIEPPARVSVWRSAATERLRLSVSTSIIKATPLGP